jgi:DNA-binding CsgD family transcriptional regulator
VVVACPVVVGRDLEQRLLLDRLEAAERARGGLVLITGPPGIGKSRLLGLLGHQARSRGDRVLVGAAVSGATDVPFRAIADAFLGVDVPDDPDLLSWRALLTGLLPSLTPTGEPPGLVSKEATPAARAEALLRLLRSLTAERPLVLGVEDFQWADPDTTEVLEHLVAHLVDERVLVAVTSREGPMADRLGARRPGAAVALGPLPDDQVATMVRACLGVAGGDAEQDVERVVACSEGIPFLVEEFAGSPHRLPPSFSAMVAARLATLDSDALRVVRIAALLGQSLDWPLLVATTGLTEPEVGRALALAEEAGLTRVGHEPGAFRHALTREAIVEDTPPWLRRQLAHEALVVLTGAGDRSAATRVELMAELADLAGESDLAARLFAQAGEAALARGALTTAAAALQRAADAAEDESLLATVLLILVEALASAGRLDECASVGQDLLDLPSLDPGDRAVVHVVLAQASIGATRWGVASSHLVSAEALLTDHPDPATEARRRVLVAEVRLAERDLSGCDEEVDGVLATTSADADVRCRALTLRGRSLRSRDLPAAEAAFEEALASATTARLPLWRLHAVHELGTIDLFDHAGTDRLDEALRMAETVGAVSTATVLHLQLTAAHMFRYEHDAARGHAVRARDSAARLGMRTIQATASILLAEVAAAAAEPAQMEHEIAAAEATLVGDPEISGSAWGARGLERLFAGDRAAAREPLRRAFDTLTRLPNSGPALYLGLWPLLLSVDDDAGTAVALAIGRRSGIGVNRANRGLLALAEAVETGRTDPTAASELAADAEADLAAYPVWSDLALMLAAPAAARDGWGDARAWLVRAATVFAGHGLGALAAQAQAGGAGRELAARIGISARETEVLHLLVTGLSNKQIASTLVLSPRTVEKHVESLFRKTGTRSRAELLASPVGREVTYPVS